MVGDRKRLTDLPEHSLEEIVSLIVKDKKDLNKFFGFGLSSKLFYKSTLHVLDQHDIYFPMDMGQSAKSKSNVTMMRYMAQYDSVSKGKFGPRFVTKRRAPEPSHSGCKCCGDGTMGDGRIIEWLNECKGLRKIYFDKIDVSMPIIQLAFQRLIYQNHTSIQVFKFENDPNYTNAIENDFFNRCIRGCENLKELTVVWNLKNGMDQRDSFRFLKGVFKVLDNMPGLEALHIVVPWIDGKPQPLKAGDDTRFYKGRDAIYDNFGFKYIIIDAQLRFYYEPTIWLGNDDDDIPQIVKCKELPMVKNRKIFTFNGKFASRMSPDKCLEHGVISKDPINAAECAKLGKKMKKKWKPNQKEPNKLNVDEDGNKTFETKHKHNCKESSHICITCTTESYTPTFYEQREENEGPKDVIVEKECENSIKKEKIISEESNDKNGIKQENETLTETIVDEKSKNGTKGAKIISDESSDKDESEEAMQNAKEMEEKRQKYLKNWW